MSLRIYLDECVASRRLRDVLRGEPFVYHVETPHEVGLIGHDDAAQLAYARQNDLILVTRDADDYATLHQQNPAHSGIFVIHSDGDSPGMDRFAIARAIQNLADSGVPIANKLHVLNAWNY